MTKTPRIILKGGEAERQIKSLVSFYGAAEVARVLEEVRLAAARAAA
jgi:hypothetical protein